MAGLRACCSPHWNPSSAGKNELAGGILTEGSCTLTLPPVVSRFPTPAPAAALTLPFASAAANSAAKYSAKDL